MAFVTSGLNKIRDFMINSNTVSPGFIGVGDGTTTVAAGNTALVNETLGTTSRPSSTGQHGDYGVSHTAVYDTTELNGTTLTELGLFDSSSGTVMFVRKTHPDFTKRASHKIITFININVKSEV